MEVPLIKIHGGRLVMIINHNISALNTHRQLNANTNAVQKSLEKLSSGLKINRAGDDAAGLAISEKMRGQIRGLEMATKNAQDGISLIQTAEGALNESHAILQRMRELAVQAANDTNTESDRAELQKEVDQLAEELTRIADNTEFNTQNLLGGNFRATFHIGANENQNIEISIGNMGAEALKVTGTVESTTVDQLSDDAQKALAQQLGVEIDDIDQVNVLAKGNSVLAIEVSVDDGTGNTTSAYYAVSDVEASFDSNDAFQGLVAKSGAEALNLNVGDVYGGINISDQESANSAITIINNAIETVSAERSKLGAVQNRLEHTINNLGASAENLQAAESRIRDVDHTEAA